MTELKKTEKRPKAINIAQIEKTFKEMKNEEIKVLGISLVNELKFMKSTLKDLKKNIKDAGVITRMCQGKYDIDRANPSIASYNTMVKNYNSTIKQIYEILNSSNIEAPDTFDDDALED